MEYEKKCLAGASDGIDSYSYFCNAEEKNSPVVNKQEEASSLENSCFLSLGDLNS